MFSTLPLLVGALVALAVIVIWLGTAPSSKRVRAVDDRLNAYLDRADLVAEAEMDTPFTKRALGPFLRRLLQVAGGIMPSRNLVKLDHLLTQAGRPGGISPLDFMGLRLLTTVGAAALGWWLAQRADGSALVLLRNIGGGLLVGFIAPTMWLRSKAKRRQAELERALPDALDMLTIGVEAGLAFESAMLRVGEQWDNALSREFTRVVSEMRLGTPSSDALRHMALRCQVPDLTTFVAILIQSSQLGVSISGVLHAQADQMRVKRRQHAEEKSRQASVKIVIVIAFFILPSLFITILGPSIPRILATLGSATGG
jgi:tight adherence protein C